MTPDTDNPDAEDVQQLTQALHQQAQQVREIAETQRALAEQQQRIMDLLEAVVARVDDLDGQRQRQDQQDLEQRLADAVGEVLAPDDAGPVDADDGDPGRRMFR